MPKPELKSREESDKTNIIRSRAIIETKLIDGKPAHRVEGSPERCWIIANTQIDAMLDRVKAQTGARRVEILRATSIQKACVSRCRKGMYGVPDNWLLRLEEYSGIPVAELRRVACMSSVVQPHPKARRAALVSIDWTAERCRGAG